MSIFKNQFPERQTYRHGEQTCGCQGGSGMGEGRIWSWGLADANHYTNIWTDEQQGPTIAQGTIFSIL